MLRSSTACVDASITVPFIAGPESPSLEAIWSLWREDRTMLVAPRLIRYEVVNGIHRLHLMGVLSEFTARHSLRTLLDLPIRLYDDEHLHLSALRFAQRYALPAAYDAHYLALADHLGCEFWTADRRLARAVGDDLPWVRIVERHG